MERRKESKTIKEDTYNKISIEKEMDEYIVSQKSIFNTLPLSEDTIESLSNSNPNADTTENLLVGPSPSRRSTNVKESSPFPKGFSNISLSYSVFIHRMLLIFTNIFSRIFFIKRIFLFLNNYYLKNFNIKTT